MEATWLRTSPHLTHPISTIGSFILSVALCFVPLFNILGFEFAFAAGIYLSLFYGLECTAKSARSDRPILAQWMMSTKALIWPCVAFLVPITFNGVFVQNCNWLFGLKSFVLIVVGTGIVSSGIAVLCGQFRMLPKSAFVVIWLTLFGVGVARFYFTPQVDVFNPLGGYFPGALYDEVLQEEARIFFSRLEDILGVATVVAFVAWTKRQLSLTRFLIIACLFLVTHLKAEDCELRRSSAYVQKTLGGHQRTEHFDVFFPRSWSTERIGVLCAELEFLFEELSEQLQHTPSHSFSVYFYDSVSQKKRLMGARNTRIAKPWQDAFHIDAPVVGASVIRHELIHLFAAAFAAPPLGIAYTRFGMPNMALTEGLAEAFSPRNNQLSLHEWTAALDRINKRPRIATLLSPEGFYTSSARRAYTVCGSLIRFAADQYGLDEVKDWYRSGQWNGSISQQALIAKWDAYLDALDLPVSALAAARSQFDRPSIFRRVCAHEIAALREEINKAISTKRTQDAFRLMEKLLMFQPNDHWTRIRQIEQLALSGNLKQAEAYASALAKDEHNSKAVRDNALEWMADLTVLKGGTDDAKRQYALLLKNEFHRPNIRRLEIKLASLTQLDVAKGITEYLSLSQDHSIAKHRIDALASQFPDNGLIRYLRARRLYGARNDITAFRLLKEIDTNKLPRSVADEIRRLLAEISFRNFCFRQAQSQFDALSRIEGLTQGEINYFETWGRRSKALSKSPHTELFSCPLEIDNLVNPHHDGPREE